jgi:hypothetical protein
VAKDLSIQVVGELTDSWIQVEWEWHSRACPSAGQEGDIAVLLLPGRRLLCVCQACDTIWLDGPRGKAPFSGPELQRLEQLRTRYLAGQLSR